MSKELEKENPGVVGGRTFGKDILYLKQSLEQCNDKPILYVSRTYGIKYIVPQKQFDDLTNENIKLKNENTELKKVLKIIFKKKVDIVYLNDSNNVEEYNSHFGCVICKLTQKEFNLVKEWSDWIKN